jgi:hypothetical protein
MISALSSILAVAIWGTPIFLLVMLLPAALELRKPKDAGPRIIMPAYSKVLPAPIMKSRILLQLEEYHELDISLKPFLSVILGKLQNLDA